MGKKLQAAASTEDNSYLRGAIKQRKATEYMRVPLPAIKFNALNQWEVEHYEKTERKTYDRRLFVTMDKEAAFETADRAFCMWLLWPMEAALKQIEQQYIRGFSHHGKGKILSRSRSLVDCLLTNRSKMTCSILEAWIKKELLSLFTQLRPGNNSVNRQGFDRILGEMERFTPPPRQFGTIQPNTTPEPVSGWNDALSAEIPHFPINQTYDPKY